MELILWGFIGYSDNYVQLSASDYFALFTASFNR